MSELPQFTLDVAGNLGKKNYKEYIAHAGLLQSRFERNGEIIEEERRGYTSQELVAYLVDEYYKRAQWLAERPNIYGGGLKIEDIFLEFIVDRVHAGIISMNGLLQSFVTGDFGNLYRALTLYVRCSYAGEVNRYLREDGGFTASSGINHGTYIVEVIACCALKRLDYAKRFFPKEFGLIKQSHITITRAGNLIIGLLHNDEQWKDKALKDARKYLQGKRQVTDRAVVAYLVGLYEGDTIGMSENLQILMDNYRKGWLIMGDALRIPLHGLYLMGNLFLPENIFQQVRRPIGPGWWDAYIDMCTQCPMPAALAEPYIVFPQPLGFVNEAIEVIDKELLAGSALYSRL